MDSDGMVARLVNRAITRSRRAITRSRRPLEPARDAGFSLIEVVVSIGVIGVVMASLGTFYVSSQAITRAQATRQVAVQLANDGMERVRAYDPAALPDALPDTPEAESVNGVAYAQHWRWARCAQQTVGPDCVDFAGANPPAGAVALLRVVVEVTWSESSCPGSACSYETVTLVNTNTRAPTFNTAPPPLVTEVADQAWTLGVPLTPALAMESAGGAGTITWSAGGAPPGLVLDGSTGEFTGTPSAAGTYRVTVTARDVLNRVSSTSFDWTINAALVLTKPADQVSPVGSPVAFTVPRTGGTGPFTWTATGLPSTLRIDATTGKLTGTPTALTPSPVTVIVTVTDRTGAHRAVTFTWRVVGAIQPETKQEDVENRQITSRMVAMPGGTAPYRSWTVDGLPTGLAFDATTGVFSGAPTKIQDYHVTVTAVDSDGKPVQAKFDWMIKNG